MHVYLNNKYVYGNNMIRCIIPRFLGCKLSHTAVFVGVIKDGYGDDNFLTIAVKVSICMTLSYFAFIALSSDTWFMSIHSSKCFLTAGKSETSD